MTDLTLLYYSAHSLLTHMEQEIRDRLVMEAGDYPIISVTQKPTELGTNICVGEIGKSHYNCYKQMYIGVQEVKTEFVAMCEDDTLYNQEHFNFRPPTNDFYYNKSMWFLEHSHRRGGSYFWHKWQSGMFGCIVPTKLALKMLEERFETYPEEVHRWQRHYWMEPHKNDRLGLPNYEAHYFETITPLITMNYYEGLDGKKRSEHHQPIEADTVPYWGNANELWKALV